MIDGNEVSSLKYVSALINGRGRFGDENENLPLSSFRVERGNRTRLRIIGASSEIVFQLSIDCHKLTVVSQDGTDIRPVQVDDVIIAPGQRFDVEFTADQSTSTCYRIRAKTLKNCQPTNVTCLQKIDAYLIYGNSDADCAKDTINASCQLMSDRIVFNCPFKNFPESSIYRCFDMNTLQSLALPAYNYGAGEKDKDFDEYFINFAYNPDSSTNARNFVMPSAPMYECDDATMLAPCNETACQSYGCRCTYTLNLTYNRRIRMVLSNFQPTYNVHAHHSIHFHGHKFAVLYIGYPNYDKVTGRRTTPNSDITCNNYLCSTSQWSNSFNIGSYINPQPPQQDTIFTPAAGYVVIEFVANNPGLWFVHCHQDGHMLEGMALLLNEAPTHRKPVPENFWRSPYCRQNTRR